MLDQVFTVDVAAARAWQAVPEEQGALGVGHTGRDCERPVQVPICVRTGQSLLAALLRLDGASALARGRRPEPLAPERLVLFHPLTEHLRQALAHWIEQLAADLHVTEPEDSLVQVHVSP